MTLPGSNQRKPMTRKIFVTSFTTIIGMLFSASIMAADCSDLSGVWTTSEGSRVTLAKGEGGMLSGTYQLNSKIDPTVYPLLGFINGKAPKPKYDNTQAISFIVHWGSLGSVSSWTGVCRDGEENGQAKLETIGHQVRPVVRQKNEHMHTFSEDFIAQK